MRRATQAKRSVAVGREAIGAMGLGAVAVGATAVGLLALGVGLVRRPLTPREG
jgi:hypothetical protein